MDIQYLLFLQDLRVSSGGAFDGFFNSVSRMAVEIMPFLPFIIFWCVSRKWGYRYMTTLGLCDLVNGVIKLTVCAYRPWIRSDLIEPAGNSKVAATGYSFPSGHTMRATAVYGTTVAWQRKKRTWLAVICGVLIALTGFSRNYLGVHTPQDVVVAFAETVLLIILIGVCQRKINGNDRILDILSLIGAAAVVGVLIYITKKPYPMDYADGVLLVDPQVMMNDSFTACGAFLGLLLGSCIDRHYVHYEIPVGAENLPVLAFAGFLFAYSWRVYIAPATVVQAFGGHWGNLIMALILWLFAVAIWPVFIRKWAEK